MIDKKRSRKNEIRLLWIWKSMYFFIFLLILSLLFSAGIHNGLVWTDRLLLFWLIAMIDWTPAPSSKQRCDEMTKSSQKPPLVQEGNSAFISLSSLKHFFLRSKRSQLLKPRISTTQSAHWHNNQPPLRQMKRPREQTSKTWTMALEKIHPWLKSSIPHSLTHTRQPNNRVYNKVSQFWIRKEAKNFMAGPGELLEWTQPDVQGVQSTVESALRELIELGWPEITWTYLLFVHY